MYLEIDEGYWEHPKTLRLCSSMGNDNAGIYPIRLWIWALRGASSGDISHLSPREIELFVRFQAGDGTLFEALSDGEDSRFGAWITVGGGRKILTGWDEYDGAIIRRPKDRSSLYSGQLWLSNRRLALVRDGVCVECGRAEMLDVHHRIPAREFHDSPSAHELSNLVVLCRKHHAEADSRYRRDGTVYLKSLLSF